MDIKIINDFYLKKKKKLLNLELKKKTHPNNNSKFIQLIKNFNTN